MVKSRQLLQKFQKWVIEMKLLTIVGARPQFIKAAAVSRFIKENREIEEIIVHTGQHFDRNMSDVFFEEMDIPKPDYNLAINSLSHGAMTGRMLEALEAVILKEQPDYVIVYGDTNSTLSGALAAKKIHVKVVHVEAGLRSFNMNMPEEINRILTDRISDFLFCPTELAVKNLKKEGFGFFDCLIKKSGDVMEDSALYYATLAEERSNILNQLSFSKNGYILATVHRAENTGNKARLSEIISALNSLHKKIPVIMPLHPRTKNVITSLNLSLDVFVIDPVGYIDMVQLVKSSLLVITDSGGLQKEAFFFDKFCVTLRGETEWMELVQNGYNCLAGTKPSVVLEAVDAFLGKPFLKKHDFYGGGRASSVIINTLLSL